MATVADVLSKAARGCSVTPPNSWVSSTSLTAAEFRDHLADTVDEILERLDLPDPVTQDVVITGTGVETYSLPAAFKRLTRDPLAVYETTTNRRACIPVASNGAWTHLGLTGSAGGERFYRISGNEESGFSISFYKPLETGNLVTVSYVSRNWLTETVPTSTWTDNDATLLLPARLIELGVTWRFRQRKGMPYADRLAEYEVRMARAINDGRGIRSVNMTGGTHENEHPMRVPVPDYIPSA